MILNESVTQSEKKLAVLLPFTPNYRLECPLEINRIRRNQNSSKISMPRKSFMQNDDNTPDKRDNLIAKDICLVKKEASRMDKLLNKEEYSPQPFRINPSRQKSSRITDIFSLTPTVLRRSKKINLRVLSRRPHHMSFRNMYKQDQYDKLKTNSPSNNIANYEFSGNMLSNIKVHAYKPIKVKLLSNQSYKPANWHRNIYSMNAINNN